MSGRKMWVLVGILVIIGGAAFVLLDPLELDLLGLKQGTTVVKTIPAPHASASAAKPGAAAPAAQAPAAAPKPAAAPAPVIAPAAPSSTAVPDAAAAEALQSPLKLSTTIKAAKTKSKSAQATDKPTTSAKTTAITKTTAGKPVIPKDADLRHCLELETDAAIAKCAGE